jgi:predicted CoA-binding protein
MKMATLEIIEECLGKKRLAIIGISRQPEDFSRALWKELVKRGYEVRLVNPNTTEIDGEKCYSSVKEIVPPVEWTLIMTPPQVTIKAVTECHEAGVDLVWLHRGGGTGAVSDEALAYCKAVGMRVVPGNCPFMFLPQTQFFHKMHGFFKKMVGTYPK